MSSRPESSEAKTPRLVIRASTAWLLLAVTILTVLAFVGANLYAQARAAGMDRQAKALVDGVAPSIERLAAARGALHRMTAAARDGASGQLTPSVAADTAQRERARLDGHLDRFLSQATLPVALREQARTAMDAVERRAADVAAELVAGDLAAARTQAEGLDRLCDAADQATESLVLWNAAQASRDGVQIRQARRHASFVAYSMHGGAAAIALVAMAIAVVLARQTERLERERSRAVEERNRLAEARVTELDAFAGRVAHDIRSPLAAISLRVAVTQRQQGGGAAVDSSLARIHDCVRSLFRIVDDLLEFARAGGQPQRDAVAALSPVIEEVVAESNPTMEEMGATFTVDDQSQANVACPPGVLLSVLGNLVRNAVKFLPEGTEPRRIVIRAADLPGKIRVEVDDTGPGIPTGQEAHIFKMYVRGETSRAGLGLGLATVQRLVTAYGGAAGVCGATLGGSCFWFELPRAQEDDQPVA